LRLHPASDALPSLRLTHTLPKKSVMAIPQGDEDVLSLLDSLAESAPETISTPVQDDPASTEDEKEVLGFLDDLAKQNPRSQTPRAPGATRSSRDSARNIPVTTKKPVEKPMEKPTAEV